MLATSIDLARMQEAADGDEDFLKELVGVFLDDSALRLRELGAALAANDARVLGRTAHQLKGSSANVGAMSLYDLARQLEKLGQANELKGARDLIGDLEAEYARVRQALEHVVAA